jgi:hypothetical protein
MYHKHVMIVSYASSGINKLKASHNNDARVVIYDHPMFIVQATGGKRILSIIIKADNSTTKKKTFEEK